MSDLKLFRVCHFNRVRGLNDCGPTLGVKSSLNTRDKYNKKFIHILGFVFILGLLSLRIANLIQKARSYYSIPGKVTEFTAAFQCALDFGRVNDLGSQAVARLRKMSWASRPVSVSHSNSLPLSLGVKEALFRPYCLLSVLTPALRDCWPVTSKQDSGLSALAVAS